ncbi:MAG: hypothetical protein A3K04_09625 [Gallionellales bacterium RBG_16_56_9]|nr:MAG: hypothetical protein A3K04_09625 [Gallionellales bacterium RBG_16_56_9]
MSKTLSETLFEKYCDSHGIRWCPVAVGTSRTPDYDIFLRRFKVVTEVKEITQNKTERQAEEDLKKNKYSVVSTVPGDRVRGKISDAVPQISARSKGRFPGLLVLFGNGFSAGHIDSYQIRVAMYGFETIVFAIPDDKSVPPDAVEKKFGAKRKVTPEHNTSLSAIASLTATAKDDLVLKIFHNHFAAVPLDPKLFAHYGVSQYKLGEAEPGAIAQWVEV